MSASIDKSDLQRRMHGAIEALKHDLSGLRTGRASIALLDTIHVEVYGANMPLNQVATVSVPEARMLSVQVWDRSNVQPVEKAIRSAGLGLNPITDGQVIRLPIPELTEERRKELAKLVGQYAEKAKIAVRNVRRDGMEHLKADEKKHQISEDERKRLETEVQKLTDDTIKEIDVAAPSCRHHHGRQWPLGQKARSAARGGPSCRGGSCPENAQGCRQEWRGSPYALCLFVGKLAAIRRGGFGSQGPLGLLSGA
jgi:ribosome recycling factor